MPDKQFYTIRKTDNFEYKLSFDIKESRNGFYTTAHLYVGDPKNPCLSLSVPLTDSLKNNRFNSNDLSIAYLNKVQNMKECILSGPDSDGPSFAKELLKDVFFVVRQNYPHIHHIGLNDSSYIPCNTTDTLDLLYYSVGLYGKTWYETNFNAYFVSREKFIDYRCKVNEYVKPETKQDWDSFLKLVYFKMSDSTKQYLNENEFSIEEMYRSSKTYPLFFKKLSRTISKEKKCAFFKGWFENFIESFVVIPRNWYIDLYVVQSRQGGGVERISKRSTTRRRKHRVM